MTRYIDESERQDAQREEAEDRLIRDRQILRCPNGHEWVGGRRGATRVDPGYYEKPECPTCDEPGEVV